MVVREPRPKPTRPNPHSQAERRFGFPPVMSVIAKVAAVPAIILLAVELPDLLVSRWDFSINPMVLKDREKTEILRTIFERCIESNWDCENYYPDQWNTLSIRAENKLYHLFERRPHEFRKTIPSDIRRLYIRVSLFEAMTGDIKDCSRKLKNERSKIDTHGHDYFEFLRQYNIAFGYECSFLHKSFSNPVTERERSHGASTAIERRIRAIEGVTKALEFRPESRIHNIGADLASIKTNTLAGLLGKCSSEATLEQREKKLNSKIDNIHNALYEAGKKKTSLLELKNSQDKKIRDDLRYWMFITLAIFLLFVNAVTNPGVRQALPNIISLLTGAR